MQPSRCAMVRCRSRIFFTSRKPSGAELRCRAPGPTTIGTGPVAGRRAGGDFSYSTAPASGPPSLSAFGKELDMKTRRIVAAVAAASLAFSSVAFAQSEGAWEQSMRGNGIQNPNGPLQTPQQLRDQARVEQ